MRAGLLSDPLVIETLNRRFVCSWVIIDDVMKTIGKESHSLATSLIYLHQYPMDFMFLTPEGKFKGQLTSFGDLRGAHTAVSHPRREGQESHVDVFMGAIAEHFGEE